MNKALTGSEKDGYKNTKFTIDNSNNLDFSVTKFIKIALKSNDKMYHEVIHIVHFTIFMQAVC